jgi:hypothetical protein
LFFVGWGENWYVGPAVVPLYQPRMMMMMVVVINAEKYVK